MPPLALVTASCPLGAVQACVVHMSPLVFHVNNPVMCTVSLPTRFPLPSVIDGTVMALPVEKFTTPPPLMLTVPGWLANGVTKLTTPPVVDTGPTFVTVPLKFVVPLKPPVPPVTL